MYYSLPVPSRTLIVQVEDLTHDTAVDTVGVKVILDGFESLQILHGTVSLVILGWIRMILTPESTCLEARLSTSRVFLVQ